MGQVTIRDMTRDEIGDYFAGWGSHGFICEMDGEVVAWTGADVQDDCVYGHSSYSTGPPECYAMMIARCRRLAREKKLPLTCIVNADNLVLMGLVDKGRAKITGYVLSMDNA